MTCFGIHIVCCNDQVVVFRVSSGLTVVNNLNIQKPSVSANIVYTPNLQRNNDNHNHLHAKHQIPIRVYVAEATKPERKRFPPKDRQLVLSHPYR